MLGTLEVVSKIGKTSIGGIASHFETTMRAPRDIESRVKARGEKKTERVFYYRLNKGFRRSSS